jgi:hypothetical protein
MADMCKAKLRVPRQLMHPCRDGAFQAGNAPYALGDGTVGQKTVNTTQVANMMSWAGLRSATIIRSSGSYSVIGPNYYGAATPPPPVTRTPSRATPRIR